MKPRLGRFFLLFLLLAAVGWWLWSHPGPHDRMPGPETTGPQAVMHQQPSQQADVTIYFCKETRPQLVQMRGVIRTVSGRDDNRLRQAIEALLQGPSTTERQAGYYSEIPKATRLLSLEQRADGLRLNLSSALSQGGGADSMTHRLDQLAHTVLSVEPKRPVYLLIEGQQVSILGGEGVEVTQPLQQAQ